MVNLREIAESELRFTVGGEFGLPAVLTDPDGKVWDTDANTGEPLKAQVLYDTNTENPDTGALITSKEPIAVFQKTSLGRIPASNEKWIVEIPTVPSETAPLQKFVISRDRPPRGGNSLGIIVLYLQKVRQS
jgi:hypothetical protein